jgi:ABC-2 type transport system ATP-binding protein
MDEAERLCDRVAVVDHGRVIALGSPAELIARLGGEHLIEFVVENGAPLDAGALQTLPAVVNVRREDDAWVLAVTAPHVTLPALLDRLEREARPLTRLTTRHASLEDVFVTLTGRHLRDDNGGPGQ